MVWTFPIYQITSGNRFIETKVVRIPCINKDFRSGPPFMATCQEYGFSVQKCCTGWMGKLYLFSSGSEAMTLCTILLQILDHLSSFVSFDTWSHSNFWTVNRSSSHAQIFFPYFVLWHIVLFSTLWMHKCEVATYPYSICRWLLEP